MATTDLADVDPVFLEVSRALYGAAVDPRELWDVSKNMDAADVHVPAAPKKPGHSNTSRALVLGAAAEGLGTVRAGQEALKAVKPAAKAGKMMSTGGKAAKVGEFGLQAANLGIGMLAARKLSQAAKNPKPDPVAKAFTLKFLRPAKTVMTDAQAARHTDALARGGASGQRIVAGTALLGGAGAGHHLGRKSGKKAVLRELTPPEPVAKGILVPVAKPPINGVKAANSGGLSPGLGRHGRVIGGKTPPPKPVPVVKSLDWTGEISKVDEDKRTVFGWCSLSKVNGRDVVDLQGDMIDIGEVEKSAYRYVVESRKGGDEHRRVKKGLTTNFDEPAHTSDLIESFVVTPEKLAGMGLAPDALPLGWWTGFKVNYDQQWALVKSGRRRGMSIHGSGTRSEVTV